MKRAGGVLAAFVLAFVWSLAALADPAPIQAHRAEYLLTRDGLPFADMVMELRLTPDGGYVYRAETRPHKAVELMMSLSQDIGAGARLEEVSSGRIVAGRFRPDQYRHRRSNDEQRTLTVAFDWASGQAAIDSADRPWTMQIPPAAQDKLAVLLALRADLAAEAAELSYPVADGGRLKTYRYARAGTEEVALAGGSWTSVLLTRVKDEGEIDYRLWLAPELDYLPVRVERSENGSHYRMELTAIEPAPKPPGE
jgi:hypothetical protein